MTYFLQINFLLKYKGPYQTDKKQGDDIGKVTDV